MSVIPRIRDEAVEITTLPNGMRVVTEQMPHLATAALGVWVAAGSRHETSSEHGLAHLLEHMAFKGTTTRSARGIAEEIEAVGGELNAETNSEATAYFVRVLGEDVPRALDIIADILTKPAFDPEELEREKHVIIQEIGAYEDAPDELVFDLFMETAFAKSALGRPILGSPETVRAQSPETMRAYLARQYRTSAMVVAAAGAIDHASIVAQVSSLFADVPQGTTELAAPAAYVGGEKRMKRSLEQVHLVLGFKGVAFDDPLHEAMHVFSGILGGGMSSRLFQELREKRGLCYDVHSFFTAFTDTGIFGVYGGTGEKDLGQFVSVLIDQIAETAANPTEVEIARARAQIKVSMLTALESPARRAEQMARHVLAYGRVLSRAEMGARIDAVGVEDVRAAASILLQSPPTLSIIGPHKQMPSFGDVISRLAAH